MQPHRLVDGAIGHSEELAWVPHRTEETLKSNEANCCGIDLIIVRLPGKTEREIEESLDGFQKCFFFISRNGSEIHDTKRMEENGRIKRMKRIKVGVDGNL